MSELEHLKQALAAIRAKERLANNKANEERIKADAYLEAGNIVEDQIAKLERAKT